MNDVLDLQVEMEELDEDAGPSMEELMNQQQEALEELEDQEEVRPTYNIPAGKKTKDQHIACLMSCCFLSVIA